MTSWSGIARRIRVPLGFVFAGLYLWLARPTVRSIFVGAALAIVGLVIRAVSSGHVRKNQQLTTSGPYAYTRNPLYLGSLILAVGFALAARSWWVAAVAAVLYVAVYVPVIRAEETFLRDRFPEFETYSQEVPRLLPRFSSSGKNDGAFSWSLYWKHREYNAAVGAVLMVGALVVKLLWVG